MCFIPSRAADLYAPFEHTWLKGRLLAQLQENGDRWVVSEDLPIVIKALPTRIQHFRLLLVKISEALSPTDLIERLPISSLPIEAKTKIREAVDSAFLELQIAQPPIAGIEEKLNRLDFVSKQIGTSWSDRTSREASLDKLRAAAQELRDAFLALPSEIIFP